MPWIDVWKEEPPRNKEIFFVTGDKEVHHGIIFSEEKLRKCIFHSYSDEIDYDCDKTTPLDYRVIYWMKIPDLPEEQEDDKKALL